MKCEKCNGKNATVHYTEIINNKMVKINLCEKCAKKKGIDVSSKFSISELLSGLTEKKETEQIQSDRICPSCGLSYKNFQDEGRFRCDQCYETFAELLDSLFEAIHRSTHHVGKIPLRWSKKENEHVDTLEKRLTKAIQDEDFEKACGLRDKIRGLKK